MPNNQQIFREPLINYIKFLRDLKCIAERHPGMDNPKRMAVILCV